MIYSSYEDPNMQNYKRLVILKVNIIIIVR